MDLFIHADHRAEEEEARIVRDVNVQRADGCTKLKFGVTPEDC